MAAVPATRTVGGNQWAMEVEERLAELARRLAEIERSIDVDEKKAKK
jgi:hypothetical protein